MQLPPNTLLVSDDRETVLCAQRGGFAVLHLTDGDEQEWVEIEWAIAIQPAEQAFEMRSRPAS